MNVAFARQPVTGTLGERPLCVDAQGALIRGNPIWEAWFALLRQRPASAIGALLKRCLGSNVEFTNYLSTLATFEAAELPYDETVLDRLKRAKADGRPITLASSLPEPWTRQIAAHLGLFDTLLAGDGQAGGRAWMSPTLTALYGGKAFDYVGSADSPVWPHAHGGIVIAPEGSEARAERCCPDPDDLIIRRRASWRTWLRQIRMHQWLKNLLIYVPLVASRNVGDPRMAAAATAGFLAFGCVASASYILNDLLDLPHDRHHPTKRHRPLAAGMLSVPAAVAVMGGLFTAGGLLASVLPVEFAGALLLYLCGTLAYSLFLKRCAPLDAFTLAGLYTVRVLAGNAVTGLPPSFWLLAFSIFLFLSLAMAKRHAELLRLGATGESATHGRGYLLADREMVSQLGVGSGYVSVLVLALYFNSPKAALLYGRPEVLWLLCVLLLYWITRLWLVAHRGQLDDDPVVFAIRDPISRVIALAVAVLLILA